MSHRIATAVFFVLAASSGFADEPPFVATAPPRSPAEETPSFTLPPGFEAQLVAAEPDIQKPINMAFDSRGRLWVTCTIEYPYPAKPARAATRSRSSTTSAPMAEARKITTFADGLNIPIGILPDIDGNGCIVWSIPNIWHFATPKGAGRADKREVLFTGFGYKDTHGMISSLSADSTAGSTPATAIANESERERQRRLAIVLNSGNTFRFKPDGSHIEVMMPRPGEPVRPMPRSARQFVHGVTVTRSRSRNSCAGQCSRAFPSRTTVSASAPTWFTSIAARRRSAA